MADVDELHQAARELPVRQHNELISQQFAIACHLPQHPCHQLCHRPPDDRSERRRSLIGRLKPDIQQYLAEDPLSITSYNSAISSIHQDAVRTAIENSSSKLLNGRPPPIATAEQTLPRKTRTILALLRTGHSRIIGQYMNRIDPSARNHCHHCDQSPHDTQNFFDCPSKPAPLTVESLWTAPTETANHLNLPGDWCDELTTTTWSSERSIYMYVYIYIINLFISFIFLLRTYSLQPGGCKLSVLFNFSYVKEKSNFPA